MLTISSGTQTQFRNDSKRFINRVISLSSNIGESLTARALALVLKTVRFLLTNPGILFIVGFQVLLLVCAVLMVSGLGFAAEALGILAYFFLLIGTIIRLYRFRKGP
jgi:hypothetical protein